MRMTDALRSSKTLPYSVEEKDFVTHYSLPHPKFVMVPSFRWYDAPVFGVGKHSTPMISLDRYMNGVCVTPAEMLAHVNKELEEKKHILEPYIKGLVVNGVVPKEINDGVPSIDSILLSRSPIGYWQEEYKQHIAEFEYLSQIKSFFYERYGLEEYWRGVCHLRQYTNFANKHKSEGWLPYAEQFPVLKSFIESLPFKQLGYALFFISKPNMPVYIHRDTFCKNHHLGNFINIQIDGKPKPTFVYDSMHKKRHYLQPYSSFYTFYEGDLHGVDAEPEERWMLRVEGVFQDWFAEELRLKNSEAFNWDYSAPQAFLRQHPEGIRIERKSNI